MFICREWVFRFISHSGLNIQCWIQIYFSEKKYLYYLPYKKCVRYVSLYIGYIEQNICATQISINICVFHFSDVTVLLSLTVFSLMVTEMLPKVSDANPILGQQITVHHCILFNIMCGKNIYDKKALHFIFEFFQLTLDY